MRCALWNGRTDFLSYDLLVFEKLVAATVWNFDDLTAI
jgi:hypothetical protein